MLSFLREMMEICISRSLGFNFKLYIVSRGYKGFIEMILFVL